MSGFPRFKGLDKGSHPHGTHKACRMVKFGKFFIFGMRGMCADLSVKVPGRSFRSRGPFFQMKVRASEKKRLTSPENYVF